MISFGLIDRKGYRGTKIRRRSKKTDGPAIVRHASPDAAGNVIPWSSKKDAPGIKDVSRGQSKHPRHQKAIDKADVLVKRVVWATSPTRIRLGALGGFARLGGVGLQRFWHLGGVWGLPGSLP